MPHELICPISMSVMTEPVVAADGRTYERKEFEKFLRLAKQNGTPLKSPITGQPLGPHGHILFDNTNLRVLGAEYTQAAKRRRALPVSPSRLVADALLHDAAPPPLKKQKPLVSPPPAPPSRATPETKKPRMRWMPWNGGS